MEDGLASHLQLMSYAGDSRESNNNVINTVTQFLIEFRFRIIMEVTMESVSVI